MGDMIKYADDTNIWEYLSCQDSTDSIQEVTNSVVDWSVFVTNLNLIQKNVKEMVINPFNRTFNTGTNHCSGKGQTFA